MIVVDAGAFVELLVRSPSGLEVEDALVTAPAYAPHLLDAEVLHRLLQFGKHGQMTADGVATGVEDLRDAPIIRVDHRPLLRAARRCGAALSGYDALYLALADVLHAQLLTTDARLARTAREQFGVHATAVGRSER